ncbi:HTH-type transcriptional regulator LrpC [Paenibacillus sp. P1XP2]|nr:HTH-type transcriptional regulator LrpC [Paenibacillus sp. P1XP2]
MDQTDLKILNILQDNARITISELGRMINMTGPAVTERVRRLEEKGVIRSYRAMLSPEKLGKAITAFVAIQANRCDLFTDFCRRSRTSRKFIRSAANSTSLSRSSPNRCSRLTDSGRNAANTDLRRR